MRHRARYGVTLAIASAAALIASGCSSAAPTGTGSAFTGAAQPAGSWADPNGNLANTRDVAGAQISAIEKTDLGVTASALLGSLGLLFVPAGVGIVQQLPLIGAYALAIFVALLVSTVLTLIVTVYVFIFVKRAIARSAPADGGS